MNFQRDSASEIPEPSDYLQSIRCAGCKQPIQTIQDLVCFPKLDPYDEKLGVLKFPTRVSLVVDFFYQELFEQFHKPYHRECWRSIKHRDVIETVALDSSLSPEQQFNFRWTQISAGLVLNFASEVAFAHGVFVCVSGVMFANDTHGPPCQTIEIRARSRTLLCFCHAIRQYLESGKRQFQYQSLERRESCSIEFKGESKPLIHLHWNKGRSQCLLSLPNTALREITQCQELHSLEQTRAVAADLL